MTTVFVYGTLTDADRAAAILAEFRDAGPATLEGLHRVDAGEYPTLAPGNSVDGRLLETDEIPALDRYEGVDRGLYVRVAVPLRVGDRTVETYVGDPDRLGAGDEVGWPGDGPFDARVRGYVDANDVHVRRG